VSAGKRRPSRRSFFFAALAGLFLVLGATVFSAAGRHEGHSWKQLPPPAPSLASLGLLQPGGDAVEFYEELARELSRTPVECSELSGRVDAVIERSGAALTRLHAARNALPTIPQSQFDELFDRHFAPRLNTARNSLGAAVGRCAETRDLIASLRRIAALSPS
jgi:hypothetical protein